MNDISELVSEVLEEYRGFSHNPFNIPREAKARVPTYLLTLQSSYVRTLRDIVRVAPPAEGKKKVLEIGAYFGVVSLCLSRLGYEVCATDIPEYISNPGLQAKFKENNVAFSAVNLNGHELPFPEDSFDVVVMCEVLEHLNFNPLPVIKEINRCMVKGGLLYLSLPNIASFHNRRRLLAGKSIHNPVKDFFAQLDAKGGMIVGLHWREYTMGEVGEVLKEMGFSVPRQYYFSECDGSASASPVRWVKRGILKLFPSMKENHTTFALKVKPCEHDFHFTDATAPSRNVR